jgi:hypothetical protein
MEFGDAVHAYLLEGERAFAIIEAPDFRTKAAREARDAARADGKTPLLAHRWLELQAMAEAVQGQLQAFDPVPFTLEGGIAEQSIYWEEDGIQCRATPDWVTLDFRHIFDLKTTSGSAHPAAVSRTLWDKGWSVQEAWYRRGVWRVHGVRAEFAFVVCETEPPYAVSMVSLDPEAAAFADRQVAQGLAEWRRCVETNTWPSYPRRTCFAEVPPYVMAAFEMRSYYAEVGG